MAADAKETGKPKPLILVVDDDPGIRRIIQIQLDRAGYLVLTAENGEEALKVLRDTVPSVIILDVMMPGMSGYDVCQVVKRSDRLEKIPVIFLTAKGSPQDYKTGMDSGAIVYMVKPFSHEKLLQMVQMMAGPSPSA